MDDIILIHHSKDSLKQTIQDVIRFLQNLGWRLSPNKCVLIPKMTFQYLGWQFQTASMEVTMTLNRRREMKKKLQAWIQMTNERQIVTTRSLASLIGDINYLRFQFPQISLWMNSLNNLKTKAVVKGGWEASVKLNKQILGNLQTIIIKIKQNRPRQLKDRTPNITLTTDTSEDGWGMILDHSNKKILDAGQWEGSWHLHFSNQRELAAVLISLRNQQQTLTDWETKCILLKTDNTTTEFVIRKWKAASTILHLVREIFLLLNNLDIIIYNEHLPGLENSTADALSRLSWIGDYQINPILLNEALHQINFQPMLDAFAHKTNKQLKRYCSPQEDNKAIARNALNIPWTNELLLLHPPIGLIPKVILKIIRDQVETVLILPRCNTKTIRSSSNQRKDNERTLKTTTRNHRNGKHKYKEGEQLYRELAELTRLDSTAIDQLIASINPETWRKRRAGLTPLANYLKQNNIITSTLLDNKPDVELVNALAWHKDRGGPKLQKRMKNMKMHCGVVLSQFSQMNDINNSSLVKTYYKGQVLSIQSQPRFPTIWNLQILFSYINTQTPTTSEEIQQIAMAMIVAFCAARMTELVFMKQSEMIDNTHSISLKTQTSKGKQVVIHTITSEERSGICCPLPASSEYCSHQLTAIIRRAGITSPYTGPTIRHAMMTRLRAVGASQAEVNAFTRHAMTSNVVDNYYNKPVERDLASILIMNEKRLNLNIFVGHVSKTAWIWHSPITRSHNSLRLRRGRTGESWGNINRRGKRIRRVVIDYCSTSPSEILAPPLYFEITKQAAGNWFSVELPIRIVHRTSRRNCSQYDNKLSLTYDINSNSNDVNVFASDSEITETDADAGPALSTPPMQKIQFFILKFVKLHTGQNAFAIDFWSESNRTGASIRLQGANIVCIRRSKTL
ncbi:MAG: hypothetical protein EZS28_000215 [Streblomastix strix]|uniref:Reverse transcriptase domain-containing protein n=1 Tax=Streblomastix strix TaxID=222440 RepID=A0A5J4XAN2_9EUKA|nr:MAG: hypothetical protein EZS28_000215 [Streblomastix strix]